MCGDWRDNKGKRGRQRAKKNRREMKVNVSEDSLSKARKLFEEHNELNELIAGPGTEAPKFAGFASASGKTISVSKEALKEARKI